MTRPVSASFHHHGQPATEARLEVRHWVPRERLLRALQGLGMGWGAAVLAVLVPALAACGPYPACGVELAYTPGQARRSQSYPDAAGVW